MLLLPSLMIKKSFWTSELRLLTSDKKEFFFKELEGRNILQTHNQAQIPVIRRRRKLRFSWKRWGCLVRTRRWVAYLPLPSVLLANVQSLENKWDELKARIYPNNGTLKTVISYVSPSRGWRTTLRTYNCRIEQQPLVRHGAGAYAYIQKRQLVHNI